jgi:hypothetical protein
MSGSHNEFNVLQLSSVFSWLVEGNALVVNYEINRHALDEAYYLDDGIYPDWSTLVKDTSALEEEKKKRFIKQQKSYRKYVERAFDVLQS